MILNKIAYKIVLRLECGVQWGTIIRVPFF